MNNQPNTQKEEKEKKRRKAFIIIAFIAVIGFSGAFAYYAYDYYQWWRDGQLAQENTDIVAHMFMGQMEDINRIVADLPRTNPLTAEEVPVSTISFSTSMLDEARALTNNPDIVAYLYIENTNINNVILQGPDNHFYLYHDMFGNFNINGAVFLDYRNSFSFTDPNTVVYGHNMRNGTMFHNLRYFTDPVFAAEHPHIKVITDERVFIYEIFSVFTTFIDFDYIQVEFDTREEFGELVTEISRRRLFNTGVIASQYDNILVLSTCTNVHLDSRIVVTGRLMKIFEIEREG